MKAIEKYIDAMINKDYKALSELFDDNGSYNDYCAVFSERQNDYHIFGKEAIEMFFRNKFAFFQYGASSPEILNDNTVIFLANMGGYYIKVMAEIESQTEDGKIIELVVRPK